MQNIRYVLEITFFVIVLGLVLRRATEFEKVAKSVSDSYVQFVKVLQGSA